MRIAKKWQKEENHESLTNSMKVKSKWSVIDTCMDYLGAHHPVGRIIRMSHPNVSDVVTLSITSMQRKNIPNNDSARGIKKSICKQIFHLTFVSSQISAGERFHFQPSICGEHMMAILQLHHHCPFHCDKGSGGIFWHFWWTSSSLS